MKTERGLGINEPTKQDVLHFHGDGPVVGYPDVLPLQDGYMHAHGIIGAGNHKHMVKDA